MSRLLLLPTNLISTAWSLLLSFWNWWLSLHALLPCLQLKSPTTSLKVESPIYLWCQHSLTTQLPSPGPTVFPVHPQLHSVCLPSTRRSCVLIVSATLVTISKAFGILVLTLSLAPLTLTCLHLHVLSRYTSSSPTCRLGTISTRVQSCYNA